MSRPGNKQWRKSTYSDADGNCVEVRINDSGTIAVRDSKDPNGPAIEVGLVAWQSFVDTIRQSTQPIDA